jgi:hypothetical protein
VAFEGRYTRRNLWKNTSVVAGRSAAVPCVLKQLAFQIIRRILTGRQER